ncbi:MAG: non-canonical purine NTP pyrophosphatase [Opitutaceae bacterium]|jgi:XTP/dITP diphosphohydrolase|nr:non-canonical purine NTP pyrophosphatase [Opitutaceae bacterium]
MTKRVETTIYLASGNAHKVAELAALAARDGLAVEILSAKALGGMPAVEEDTGTFAGNARKKALALRAIAPAGTAVLADDSGVCVDHLDGGPGVESAYFAGPQGDSAANLRKLEEVMRGVPAGRRGARFYCLLYLIDAAGGEHVFEGECRGVLLDAPRGGAGFGYDPLFVPEGFSQSYAELGDEVKSRLSHRARAWAALSAWWRGGGAAVGG